MQVCLKAQELAEVGGLKFQDKNSLVVGKRSESFPESLGEIFSGKMRSLFTDLVIHISYRIVILFFSWQHFFSNFSERVSLIFFSSQKNPVLIKIETKAGHGAGKPTAQVVSYLPFNI